MLSPWIDLMKLIKSPEDLTGLGKNSISAFHLHLYISSCEHLPYKDL